MRRFLTASIAIALPALLACTSGPPVTAGTSPTSQGDAGAQRVASAVPNLNRVRIRWGRVAGGFSSPTQVTSAHDGTSRLFVVEQGGRIKVVRQGHQLRRLYVNLSRQTDPDGEGGLLSVAFSPTFRRDKLLWVAYSRRSDGDLVVARMRAASAHARSVSSRTLRTVLVVEHTAERNHYGGQLAFGPDGKLYVGTGDGGGSGDPFNTAGDRRDLRGKILRISVMKSCGNKRYCIPPNNPFADRRGRDEIWLMGLRNPWRFSFDAPTRALWIGDVGQGEFEEVNRVPASPTRRNLGWSCREGRQVYDASRCRSGVHYRGPTSVVAHPQGASITGGFVYRGSKYRGLIRGAYVFSDFVTRRVWLFARGQGKHVQQQRLGSSDYRGATSFGVDDRGEIFAVTYDGVLWRMRASRP